MLAASATLHNRIFLQPQHPRRVHLVTRLEGPEQRERLAGENGDYSRARKNPPPLIPHDQKNPGSTRALLNDHLSGILIRMELQVLRQLSNAAIAAQKRG